MITIQRQLELLWENVLSDGKPKTVAEVARMIGVTEQTLLNLLHGRAHDPRLHTLHGLIECFGISLDYFNLRTEAECLDYLAKRGKLGAAPDLLKTINTQARTLSPDKSRDVLTILQWRILGLRL
jgi:transcriptional regulator with XRE-family HTH domain